MLDIGMAHVYSKSLILGPNSSLGRLVQYDESMGETHANVDMSRMAAERWYREDSITSVPLLGAPNISGR